jgi:calcineurin-like phosphoesterase family protein
MANNKTPQVFFVSDTHYSHSNICRGITKWGTTDEDGTFHRDEKGTRDFDTLEEMNDAIVKGINDKVMPDDILYHLGDWSFGGFDNIKEFRDRINCKNVHLILGNHDHHIARNKGNITDLFSSVAHYRELKISGQTMIMSHYPMVVWNHHYDLKNPSIMLFGHCHGNLDAKHLGGRKTMDIGIDTHPEFRPYHIDEIKEIMETRTVEFVDHHNAETTNHNIVEK